MLRASSRAFHPARGRYSKVGRISGSAQAQVIHAERTRFGPGAVARALDLWAAIARAPDDLPERIFWPGCGERSCCPSPGDDREVLERVIRSMPRKSAKELRAIVQPLDDAITSHPSFAFTYLAEGNWWIGDY